MLKKLFGAALLAALAILPCRAADIQVYPTGLTFSISGGSLPWGSGASSFNNNFFFVTSLPQGNACVYVYNNNPTNAHPFNITLTGTANPQEITPSDGTWQFIPGNPGAGVLTGTSVGTSPSIPVIVTASLSGFSKISVNLSGSSALGGTPDTANVVIIQTAGQCGAGPIADPCQNSQFTKISLVVNVSGIAVTQIVSLVAGKTIYVCGYSIGFTGTSPTITWITGSGANCGTSQASISGAIPVITGSNITIPTTSTQFQETLGNALCIQLGGTTPTGAGYVTFIYQ